MLGDASVPLLIPIVGREPTVNDTSSSIMLNLAALRDRLSRTSLATFSRCVIS